MYDLIVAGGGPAGLAAALYAARKHLQVLLVSPDLGGRTNQRLALPWVDEADPAWNGVVRGLELSSGLRREFEASGLPYEQALVEQVEAEDGTFVVFAEGRPARRWEGRAVVVATGTRHLPLDVPGEREHRLRALSYSALSHAAFFSGRTSAVVGEGELAVRAAAELSALTGRVYLVCSQGEMLHLPLGKKLRLAPNVRVLEGFTPVEIQGDGQGYARCLVVKNAQGERQRLEVDGIFVERGLTPNSGLAGALAQLDSAGRIRVDAMARTSWPGLFAAGDVTNLYAEQIPVAVGEGVKAALSAFDYLLRTG